MQTQGEYVKSTQESPSLKLNLGSSCCDVTLLVHSPKLQVNHICMCVYVCMSMYVHACAHVCLHAGHQLLSGE